MKDKISRSKANFNGNDYSCWMVSCPLCGYEHELPSKKEAEQLYRTWARRAKQVAIEFVKKFFE